MKKQTTTNTFQEGMVSDFNPLVTPNNVLTGCLNGTIITYNGNENVLQNDMGNGRVETAYLPEGYIPIGTTELGGIIYIVSYNPLLDKCQIGSFPSPERNVLTQEIQQPQVVVGNKEFWDNDYNLKNTLLKVKLLSDNKINKLNPGDKYIIYSDGVKGNLLSEEPCLSDGLATDRNKVDATPRHVTIHVVSIGQDGKITYLDDSLKWHPQKFGEDGDISYYIKHIDLLSKDTISSNIDEYRSLVNSGYNIFNSKVSGELALLFEVKVIDSFSVTWDAEVKSDPNDTTDKSAVIKFEFYWETQDERIAPSYVILTDSQFSIMSGGESGDSFEGEDQIQIQKGDYVEIDDTKTARTPAFHYIHNDNSPRIWNYTLTPAMKYGKIPYLAVSGSINFTDIGSGKIEVDEWRYYIQDKSFYLSWGLDAYPEKNKSIKEVIFTFIPFDSAVENREKLLLGKTEVAKNYSGRDYVGEKYYQYIVRNKKSYSGNFQEIISFSEDGLQKNHLYLVDVGVVYGVTGNNSTDEVIHNYQWLYTTGQWNKEFIEGTEENFNNIQLDLDFQSECAVEDTIIEKIQTTKPSIPQSLPAQGDEMHYSTLGAKVLTVNYDGTSFNKNPNLSLDINVIPSYPELFSVQIQENDKFTNSIANKKVSYNQIVESDQPSIIANKVKSKSMTPETTDSTVAAAINGILKGPITQTIDDNAVDYINAEIIDGATTKNPKISVWGSLFSRINADLTIKTATINQTVRPVLLETSDFGNLGIQDTKHLNTLFGFGCEYNPGGARTPMCCFQYEPSSTTNTLKVIQYDSKARTDISDDQYSVRDYWEVPAYNDILNEWLLGSNNPFAVVKYVRWGHSEGDDRYTTLLYDTGKQPIRLGDKWGIWVRTNENHYIPVRGFFNSTAGNNEKQGTSATGSADAQQQILAILAQLYYVDTNPTPTEKCLVENINKLKPYTATWTITLKGEVQVADKNKSVLLGKRIPLSDIANVANILGISTKNVHLESSDTGKDIIEISEKDIIHNFRINVSDLYNKYEELKSTIIQSIWKLSTSDNDIIGNSKNPSFLYVYDQNISDFLSLDNKSSTKLYTKADLIENTSTGRITISNLSNPNTVQSQFYGCLTMDSSNNLVAKESELLAQYNVYRYYPDNGNYIEVKRNAKAYFLGQNL